MNNPCSINIVLIERTEIERSNLSKKLVPKLEHLEINQNNNLFQNKCIKK